MENRRDIITMKTELESRPVYLQKDDRIKGLFLSVMFLYCKHNYYNSKF